MRFPCLVLLLLAASVSAAEPIPKAGADPVPSVVTIEAVQPVTAEVGKKCVVEVKTSAKKVTWRVPADVDFILLTPDGKKLGVWALPGTYPLTAHVVSGEDVVIADVSVTITGNLPNPVIPALNKTVKAAYDADTNLRKLEFVKKMAALYRAAGTVTVKDTSIKTYFDLYSDVAAANAGQMEPTDLQGIRQAIAKYLDGKLPTDKKTAIDRTLAGAEFINVAAALEAVLPK